MIHTEIPELSPSQFAEWVCDDPIRMGAYTETSEWVQANQHNPNYLSPVGAAFSIAQRSLMVVSHNHRLHVSNPKAWDVARVDLASGSVRHSEVISASLDRARHLWLQEINTPSARFAEQGRLRRDQRRVEAYVGESGQLRNIEQRRGLLSPQVDYHDLTALDALVQCVLSERQALLLSDTAFAA